jgi:hypothetical protein
MRFSRTKVAVLFAAVAFSVAATTPAASASVQTTPGCTSTRPPGVGWRYVKTYVAPHQITSCFACLDGKNPRMLAYCWDLGTGNTSYWEMSPDA